MEKYRLIDICDFQGGSQPPKEEWKSELEDGYIRMLQIRDFTQDYEKKEYIKITNSTKICKNDDILIARYGASIGKILTGLEGAYNVAIMKTIPNENIILKKYLYYYLKSNIFQNYLKNVGSRAAQAGFNKEELKQLEINVPSKAIQKQIINKFQNLENIIDLKKSQLEGFEELVKSQFVEMFGEPLTSNNYGRITLDRLTKVNQGLQIPISKRFNEDGENRYKYITIQFLNGGKQTEYIENPNARVVCTKDDILMTRTGNTGQVITNVEGVFHNNFFKVDYDREKINKEFLIKYFEDDGIYRDMLRRATTSTIPDLSHSEFYKMSIDLPPIELQNKFAEFVKLIDKQKFVIVEIIMFYDIILRSILNNIMG